MSLLGKIRIMEISGFIIVLIGISATLLWNQAAGLVLILPLLILGGGFLAMFLLTRKAEEEILEKYHWYEQIIDFWENPLSITDMNMNWTFVNKTVEGLLNKKRDEVIGQHCSNWGANICNSENCGVNCLRRGKQTTFFNQWETDFRVDSHYLTNRKGEKVGHIEIVTNIHAQKQLNQLLNSARRTAESVAAGSRELTNSAQTLSTGATEQAASIEEITSSLNEVASQTKQNSDNAELAQKLSSETRDTVQTGNQQMKIMVESMNTISETSSEVTKVIKVIDEIAFQTNLLALNAAVEAARAGKFGKGFAVVAEEVRSLASRSAAAAKDTTELIDKSIKGVEDGVRNANETAAVLSEIGTSMEKMHDLVSDIAASSIEQNSSIGEVNAGLAQVNTVVQQNASVSEENASASEELRSQVDRLLNLTKGIQITENIGDNEPERDEPVSQKPAARGQAATTGDTADFNNKKQLEPIKPEMVSKSRLIELDDDSFGRY